MERETAKRYVEAIIRLNQTETAEEIEVARQTVQNYKKAFSEMSQGKRAFVLHKLVEEFYQSYFDEKVIEEIGG